MSLFFSPKLIVGATLAAGGLGAATVGGGAVLGLDDEVGRLAVGYRADVVLVDDPDWRQLIAQLGAEPARVIRG